MTPRYSLTDLWHGESLGEVQARLSKQKISFPFSAFFILDKKKRKMFMIDMILIRLVGQAGRGETGREFFLRTTVGLSGCKSWNTIKINASLQNQTCVKVMAKKITLKK